MEGKVLIVDDDPVFVTILEDRLAQAGYHVESTSNGREAMEMVRSVDPDIVLSDIMMPEMDGYELQRRLRSDPETAAIPFIFLSAKCEPTDQLEGLRMGADDYVCKPFDFEDLVDRIEQAIAKVARVVSYSAKADFSGNVNQMSIADVLQIVEINHKSGELIFKNEKGKKTGKVFFQKGALVHARTARLSGEEAFYQIMGEKKGFFEFFGVPVDVPRTISTSNMSMLLNGTRLLDEAESLCELVEDRSLTLNVLSLDIGDEIKEKIGEDNIEIIMHKAKQGATLDQILKSGRMSRLRAASALSMLLKEKKLAAGKIVAECPALVDPAMLSEIRRIAKNAMTGVLEIRKRLDKEAIYFEEGQIVHAFSGHLDSKKALFRILSKSGGEFVFVEGPVPVARSINGTLEMLVETAEKEMEGLSKFDNAFFNSAIAVKPRMLSKIPDLEGRKSLMKILGLAQQYDTIREIVDASPFTDLVTCKVLVELIRLKVLRFDVPVSRRISLVTDGAADIPDALAETLDVVCLPFALSASGATFQNSREIAPEVFYEKHFSQGQVPVSTSPSAQDFDDLFRKLLPGSDIFALLSSSMFSGAVRNARTALERNMEDYHRIGDPDDELPKGPKLEIVDSRTVSCGLGLLVALAAEKIKTGINASALREHMDKLIPLVWTFVVCGNPDLFSPAIGRPTDDPDASDCLYALNSGKLVEKKRLGRGESGQEKIVELFGKNLDDPDIPLHAAIAHAGCPKKAERVKDLLELNFGNMKLHVLPIGGAFGARCGPGAIAASYIPELK